MIGWPFTVVRFISPELARPRGDREEVPVSPAFLMHFLGMPLFG